MKWGNCFDYKNRNVLCWYECKPAYSFRNVCLEQKRANHKWELSQDTFQWETWCFHFCCLHVVSTGDAWRNKSGITLFEQSSDSRFTEAELKTGTLIRELCLLLCHSYLNVATFFSLHRLAVIFGKSRGCWFLHTCFQLYLYTALINNCKQPVLKHLRFEVCVWKYLFKCLFDIFVLMSFLTERGIRARCQSNPRRVGLRLSSYLQGLTGRSGLCRNYFCSYS